jgi:hypothetical protein
VKNKKNPFTKESNVFNDFQDIMGVYVSVQERVHHAPSSPSS